MKLLSIFFALLATAASYPIVKTWTLSELSEAIERSESDSSMRPYLEDALNQIMLALFTGKNESFIRTILPSPSGGTTWTLDELTKALADPGTRPEHRPALLQTYGYVMNYNATGEVDKSVEVAIPALDISTWTQSELNEAISSSDTKAELRPHLEKARSELTTALSAGEKRETINIVTPVGWVPAKRDSALLAKPTKRFYKKYFNAS